MTGNRDIGQRSGARFEIVVFNYQRLHAFAQNIFKIENIRPDRDRITIVSASPDPAEKRAAANLEAESGAKVRYIPRHNFGIDQYARAEYFTGAIGSLESNLGARFLFQMQDHYLDTESPFSRWGSEMGNRIKGDVTPEGMTFDLDCIESTLESEDALGAFCDQNNPAWFEVNGKRYVAPSGGNFIIRSSVIRTPRVQRECKHLMRSCDDTYLWAVYAEFKWGEIFFREGERFHDLKRRQTFQEWARSDFYLAPDDYLGLRNHYEVGPIIETWRQATRRARRAARSILDIGIKR